ncbi:MAG TPA: type II toxin-antitoxin system HicA family toxin [Solirubrobacteraceae bacterium]|nr:type II toxin-antitoxin system HicA family toxin [Solirubrobacteraceae bacterium]
MRPKKLLARIARGTVVNVSFTDMQNLVEDMGFELRRVNGSHHLFVHPDVPTPVNLQSAAARDAGKPIPEPRYRPAIYA